MNDNELRDTLKKQNKKFVLIYKSNPRLLSFYKDYNIIMVNNFGAETKKLELAEDIIITNLEIR